MQAVNPPSSLYERLTTQTPLMWFSLAFLAGIVLGSLFSLSLWTWLALAVLAIFLSIFAQVFSAHIPPALFLLRPFTFILFASLFVGAARYQYSVPDFDA